jgi:methionyl-tRNA formyltransferase
MSTKKEVLDIVFMGTPEFAVGTLEAIHNSLHNIVGIVTVPDKPAGRGRKLRASSVKNFAEANNYPLAQPEKLRDEAFLSQLRAWRPDVIVVVAFRMLPKSVWSMPSLGTFNVHASLLPEYRGAAPINWALINGDSKTGVTTFFIDEEIDTGNILLQAETKIEPNELLEDLYERLMHIGAELAVQTLDGIASNSIKPVSQKDQGDLRSAPKLNSETGHIDWNADSADVHNLIRGLSPFPGAWTELVEGNGEKKKVKLFRTLRATGKEDAGLARIEGKRLFVGTGNGRLEILELQPAGKKRMGISDFINGLGGKSSLKFT